MDWRLAKSLDVLRSQMNQTFPNRSKASDGSIGDAAHATRDSDHNPWVMDSKGQPVVTAIDITHDPKNGVDSYAFADMLMAKKDPRIKYVISNKRIASGARGPSPWKWRKYTGKNPHDHHVHISVLADEPLYDSMKEWDIKGFRVDPNTAADFDDPLPLLKKGSTGQYVIVLQTKLQIPQTGTFDDNTHYAVWGWQLAKDLTVDGVVGPQTWKSFA